MGHCHSVMHEYETIQVLSICDSKFYGEEGEFPRAPTQTVITNC